MLDAPQDILGPLGCSGMLLIPTELTAKQNPSIPSVGLHSSHLSPAPMYIQDYTIPVADFVVNFMWLVIAQHSIKTSLGGLSTLKGISGSSQFNIMQKFTQCTQLVSTSLIEAVKRTGPKMECCRTWLLATGLILLCALESFEPVPSASPHHHALCVSGCMLDILSRRIL